MKIRQMTEAVCQLLAFLKVTLTFYKQVIQRTIAQKCQYGLKMISLLHHTCSIIRLQMLLCYGHHMQLAGSYSTEKSLRSFCIRITLSFIWGKKAISLRSIRIIMQAMMVREFVHLLLKLCLLNRLHISKRKLSSSICKKYCLTHLAWWKTIFSFQTR